MPASDSVPLTDAPAKRSRWPFAMAVVTILGTLLGITVGALVTTKNAGMAFRDWPTSDGFGMLTYPWLKSAGDEFLEHGHRLAGMLIGVLSIILTVTFIKCERRTWAKWLAAGVLCAVIVQGLLGGFRVLFDRRVLAMVHSASGASVLSLMAVCAFVVSGSWRKLETEDGTQLGKPAPRFLRKAALILPALVLGQYLAGGALRHLGLGLYEHIGGAIIVGTWTLVVVALAVRTPSPIILKTGLLLGLVVFSQIALGLATYVMKFGWPASGYVAVKDAIEQVTVRTAHAVLGMLTLMTSVTFAAFVARRNWLIEHSTNRHQATAEDLRSDAAFATHSPVATSSPRQSVTPAEAPVA